MTTAPTASTPPSPATIASTSESQTGGDSFLPSASESVGDQEDTFGRERSASQPSLKRSNFNLNINTSHFPYHNPLSPSSLLSNGAPFTDSYPTNYDPSQDYFQVAEQGGFLSAGADDPNPPPQINQHFGYRLPASQPSSPVRTIYPPGQAPFFTNGRQRGATFSGGSYANFEQFGGPLSAIIPNHLAFTQLQPSPANSLAASPVIPTADASYFLATSSGVAGVNGVNPGLGVGDVNMDDVETPTQLPPLAPSAMPLASGSMTPDMSTEMVDRLTLLDHAKEAKNALLRGQDTEVSANLGHLSNQLEVATEMGVGPVTARDMTPGSSGVSPVQYSASPVTARTGVSPAATMQAVATPPLAHPAPPQPTPPHGQTQAPMMNVSPVPPFMGQPLGAPMSAQQLVPQIQIPVSEQPGLLPSLPVDPPSRPGPINTSLSPTSSLMPNSAGYPSGATLPVAPPLVHSHSYPNGHQLPSQLHGLSPSTPAVPSPSFAAQLGIQHAPLISSPLASVPVSRPTTPPNNRPYPIPEQPWAESAAMAEAPLPMSRGASDILAHRRTSDGFRNDGRPVINRGRSTSITKNRSVPSMTASMPPSAWQSRQVSPDGDDEDDESDEEGTRPRNKRRRSSAGAEAPELGSATALISEDIRRQLDTIFEEFLNKVCSDLDFCDSKGEKLHQVLMPKKMARLDESTDYRPFKFRIQAFTNAFHEELQNRGITEETMSVKKVKTYLWRQDLISRFNADGKKAKSKGNHIWNVDAKKLPGGGWVFRPFKRRIIGQPQAFALVGHRYEWEPKIWDPQAASDTIKPTFHSPQGSLPPWLAWDESGKLVGVPEQPSGPISITAIAEFTDAGGVKQVLETSFNVQAILPSLMPIADPRAMYAQGAYTQWTSEYPPEHLQQMQPGLMYQNVNVPVSMPMIPIPMPGGPPYPGYPNGV